MGYFDHLFYLEGAKTVYEQFVNEFNTPKNSKFAKISSLNFMFKKPYLSQYLMNSNKEGLKI